MSSWGENLSSKPCCNMTTIPYFFKQEIPNPFTTPASPKAAPRRSPYLSPFIIRSKSRETSTKPESRSGLVMHNTRGVEVPWMTLFAVIEDSFARKKFLQGIQEEEGMGRVIGQAYFHVNVNRSAATSLLLLHTVTFFNIDELAKKHQQNQLKDQATSSPEKPHMPKPRAARAKPKAASRGKLDSHLACINKEETSNEDWSSGQRHEHGRDRDWPGVLKLEL
ncbi:hypothetical protein M5K25_027332 [Dendrobium thyrsiflorum]|uniref:Uncharacterized protein n=1 Tax=Dendrobium thyrsiflorum TaxID=117978 RepID=A0ABD0TZI9_DENTH